MTTLAIIIVSLAVGFVVGAVALFVVINSSEIGPWF